MQWNNKKCIEISCWKPNYFKFVKKYSYIHKNVHTIDFCTLIFRIICANYIIDDNKSNFSLIDRNKLQYKCYVDTQWKITPKESGGREKEIVEPRKRQTKMWNFKYTCKRFDHPCLLLSSVLFFIFISFTSECTCTQIYINEFFWTTVCSNWRQMM